jgi:hypothetical protein
MCLIYVCARNGSGNSSTWEMRIHLQLRILQRPHSTANVCCSRIQLFSNFSRIEPFTDPRGHSLVRMFQETANFRPRSQLNSHDQHLSISRAEQAEQAEHEQTRVCLQVGSKRLATKRLTLLSLFVWNESSGLEFIFHFTN